jgi:hypothetical protein
METVGIEPTVPPLHDVEPIVLEKLEELAESVHLYADHFGQA